MKPRGKLALCTLTLFILTGLGLPAGADELDDLVRKLAPPARFKDHKPDFSVEKRSFTFQHYQGEQTWEFFVIKDKDRYVAIQPLPGFNSGTIYVRDFNPTTAPRELKMPTERWHIDTAIGSEMQTFAFIPNPECEREATFEWTRGDGTLTLTRRFKSDAATYNRWEYRDKTPNKVDVTNTFVFRCDPVFGYVVEATYDIRAARLPAKYQFTSHAIHGRYSLWPGTETCFRTMVSPIGKTGYAGYYLNLASICDGSLSCRQGGFVSFLNDVTGWSSATTTESANAPIGVCNAHADLDLVSQIPTDLAPDADGMKRWVQKHRLLSLPPEITKHVWDNMEVMFQDRSKVQIRIGSPEGFEDQPLPYTTRVRGMTFTSGGPEITEKFARTGKKSMVVSGMVWPNIPQIVLKPDTRYRLEAWARVVDWSPEQKQAAEGKERQRIEDLKKKGKPVEEFKGLRDSEFYITGDLYEWSPHSGVWTTKQKTSAATPERDDWQHVVLEFTSPKWGPFVNVMFIARNCTAYVDDFALTEVK